MAQWANVSVAFAFLGLLLAGCSSSETKDILAQRFGAESLALEDGQRTLIGNVLEGDVSTGWGFEPNATVEAPLIDQSAKVPDQPGGGTTLALPMPTVEQTLRLRFAPGFDAAGLRVSWGAFRNGTEPTWTEPAPAESNASVPLTTLGATYVRAKLVADDGSSVVTKPLKAMLHARWTVDSVVWPFAPSGYPPETCTPEEVDGFACIGRMSGGCAWADAGDVCVYAGQYGAGAFLCVSVAPCDEYGQEFDEPLPQAPRPSNYDEMADVFTFEVPGDTRVEVATEYRGDPDPRQGADVDVELVGRGEPECAGWGGSGGVSLFDTERAREQLVSFLEAGTGTVRVGGVSCPWFDYNNQGPVPYRVTVDLTYDAKPVRHDGGPVYETATATTSPALASR